MNYKQRLHKLEQRTADEQRAAEIREIQIRKAYPNGLTITQVYDTCYKALGEALYEISGTPVTAGEAEQLLKDLTQ